MGNCTVTSVCLDVVKPEPGELLSRPSEPGCGSVSNTVKKFGLDLWRLFRAVTFFDHAGAQGAMMSG
jgi:hypothetical protein